MLKPYYQEKDITIYHGDCLEVMKEFSDNTFDVVVTSPPYNKHSANRKCGKTDSWQKANIDYGDFKDSLPEDKYQKWQKRVIKEMVRLIKNKGSIFYNHKPRVKNHKCILPTDWLRDFNIRQLLIWDRGSSPQLAPIRWFPTTEHIYWITKTNIQPKFYKRSRHQLEIIRIPPKPMKEHPAPFPVELVSVFIENTTNHSDLILDPFLGSGTTLVACKELGRKGIGIEINKDYCDIAVNRVKNTVKEMF